MSTNSARKRAAGIVGVTLFAVVALAACGGSGSTAAASNVSNPTATSSPGATSSAGANGRRGGFGGIDAATRTKITACLKAAGITVPTARAFPSGGARPSGAPGYGTNGGARPSGAPTGAPGAGNRFGGAGGGIFGSTEAQAALKACGITLPSRPATAPSGAPTT